MSAEKQDQSRRPMGIRHDPRMRALARGLQQLGFTPNAVSMFSVVFLACGGVGLICVPRTGPVLGALLLLNGAAMTGLRALCNVLDGLIAVEGGMKSNSGGVFNELPDRLSDMIMLIGGGYAIGTDGGIVLGYLAALLAVLTAYVRALGASVGAKHYFQGPMAKPQRMAVFCAGCVLTIGENFWNGTRYCMIAALLIIVLGCIVTSARRVLLIITELESK